MFQEPRFGDRSTIPQLFFGQLDDGWRAHALASCGGEFPAKEALGKALTDLAAKAAGGTGWPALIAGPPAPGPLPGRAAAGSA